MAYLSVRVSEGSLRRLDALAEAQGLSRSRLVRRMVDAAIEGAPMPAADLPDEDELVQLLAEKARAGSVSAIRALLDREKQLDPRERALLAFEQIAAGRQHNDN